MDCKKFKTSKTFQYDTNNGSLMPELLVRHSVTSFTFSQRATHRSAVWPGSTERDGGADGRLNKSPATE